MAALWSKACGALMGMREPFSDWSTDRTGLCPACAEKQLKKARRVEPPKVGPEPPGKEK
jgi:hypothetical protein